MALDLELCGRAVSLTLVIGYVDPGNSTSGPCLRIARLHVMSCDRVSIDFMDVKSSCMPEAIDGIACSYQ